MRKFRMMQVGQCVPTLPGLPCFEGPKTYAAWPVWSDSTTKEIRFQPMPKKAATKLWHRARAFDRQSKAKGQHGGAVGHAALQVLHALIFDFLNYRSGRLDPSHAAIARAANVCERTVAQRAQPAARLRHPAIGCGAAWKGCATAASCWSRRRTPTPCCRRGQNARNARI